MRGVIYIQTDFQLSEVRTNENSRRHRRKGGTGERIVRDRDSSLGLHVLSQFAVPRLLGPFSRLSRPVAWLLPRSVTRFFLPLPRSCVAASRGNHVPHEYFTHAKTCMKTREPSSRVRSIWAHLNARGLFVSFDLIRSSSCQFDTAKSSGHTILLLFPRRSRTRNQISWLISYFCLLPLNYARGQYTRIIMQILSYYNMCFFFINTLLISRDSVFFSFWQASHAARHEHEQAETRQKFFATREIYRTFVLQQIPPITIPLEPSVVISSGTIWFNLQECHSHCHARFQEPATLETSSLELCTSNRHQSHTRVRDIKYISTLIL